MTIMKQTIPGTPMPLSVAIDALVAEYGSGRFVLAALVGCLRAPALRRRLEEMPDHLRRDIGLPVGRGPLRRGERSR
ncbi:hypothetical protein [Mangrovicoccus algicola]|uniref:DUF1127 domain-containing protein n=1 Tax=Mangrovicoccus algicola TaxID=2771008 RepID=A0A8J6ZA92_9RHOB|nr:hypothetical protein [Mangrovicoccus algicola]MBE3638996.1 hypothetical protein [Mangrovicoccus algicola]